MLDLTADGSVSWQCIGWTVSFFMQSCLYQLSEKGPVREGRLSEEGGCQKRELVKKRDLSEKELVKKGACQKWELVKKGSLSGEGAC